MPSSKKNIQTYRKKIDQIDKEILKLLTSRGAFAQEIGEIKKAQGGEVFVPAREKQIFDKLKKTNPGPYPDPAIFSIFREIISATRALEHPLEIAFLGPQATFTHMAATQEFGNAATLVPRADIAEVFREVEKEHVDYGVVPVENTSEGVVTYTYDELVTSPLKICSEIVLPISHCLMSNESELSKIKRLYSHRQAFAQCRSWIAKYLPNAKLIKTDSTANAAEKIADKNGVAAIASELAADLFGLNVLMKGIQDEVQNMTRFFVIGHDFAEKTGHDKTSFVFQTQDRVGVLYQLLKHLANAGVNLTKIESRPIKKKAWDFMFFIDVDGHVQDPKIKKLMKVLDRETTSYEVLGSYPKVTT